MAHSSGYRWETSAAGRTFQPATTTAWDLRWWILAAAGTSIVVHVGLLIWMKNIRAEPGARPETEKVTANVFETERVSIPEDMLLNPDIPPPDNQPPDLNQEVNREAVLKDLPDMSQIAEEMRDRAFVASPAAKSMADNLEFSKPAPGAPGNDLVDDITRAGSSLLDASAATPSKSAFLKPQFTKPADDQVVADAGALEGGTPDLKNEVLKSMQKGSGGNNGLDGFRNLDDLINYKGPIHGDFKAMLRTDLLFDFGSAQLRSGARVSLMNLGALILTNTEAQFRLVGHTDTIGDEASNQKLSEARAQAVKDWLANSLGIDGSRIVVEGKGEREPLPGVDPNGSADAQQLNRRVEIHKTGG